MKISGITISSPDKILFKKGKITKLQVVEYYKSVAKLMLKDLKDRPISAYRCHDEATGECFFKKHPTTEGEDIGKIVIDGEDYFYISSQKDIILQAQMGTVEFHSWGCKVPNIEMPDTMIFDLDPAPDVTIGRLRQGVRYVKDVLDQLKLKSTLKTSGGKGYHIIVKIKGKDWEEFGEIAKNIALLLEEKYPNFFTTNIRKDKRSGKIFVDYLRNKRGASCVAAYSLRARENAPISFPISWEQLDEIRPNEINIKNYQNHIKMQ